MANMDRLIDEMNNLRMALEALEFLVEIQDAAVLDTRAHCPELVGAFLTPLHVAALPVAGQIVDALQGDTDEERLEDLEITILETAERMNW